jgi:Holliday junction resolvase RusA-like endonuclease|tara:strand:- start:26 stop:388 length:363 start_codon:yes stop_codon:yes gene_type:complete
MKWFIPGNVPSSKNGRRWTGKYFIASKTVMKYRKDTQSYYKKYAKEFSKELKKHTLPVKVSFTFIRGTRHKFDYINPAQTVQDDMVKHGWIEDDNMNFMIPVFEEFQYDKKNPGVIIKIL